MQRSQRAALAAQTLAIIQREEYSLATGPTVDLREQLERCRRATKYIPAVDVPPLIASAQALPANGITKITVAQETTLAGIFALAAPNNSLGVLNFASARNPGGGFLNGSEAQEESLARSSTLYDSQQQAFAFYERHRAMKSLLYTDALILSPHCVVFRDDSGELLAQPPSVVMITCAAPNAGALAKESPYELAQVPEVLRQRAAGVFAAALSAGCRDLVLGAWGCGVFRNDPALVAGVFAEHLAGQWKNRFERVRFSIFDNTRERAILTAFRSALAQ